MAGTLSRKSMGSLRHVEDYKLGITKDLHRLANLSVQLFDTGDGGAIVHNDAESSLVAEGTTIADHGKDSSIAVFYSPRSTKMYLDLRQLYYWNDMKKSIAEYVAQCPNCQ
ncbi:uncharacterized protein [Nicotiana tomentosiformis]|uniref:uncharacterized protein n=1 Tax=Nicotiana tomentosiformis TaxID=4098 RepID=UPI00388C7D03